MDGWIGTEEGETWHAIRCRSASTPNSQSVGDLHNLVLAGEEEDVGKLTEDRLRWNEVSGV